VNGEGACSLERRGRHSPHAASHGKTALVTRAELEQPAYNLGGRGL